MVENSATPAGASLGRKLAEVMAAVERIPKNGWNDFHKYAYATEADIVEAIRGELAKRHVVILPAVLSQRRDPVGEKGQVLTTVDMEFTFLDGDTGERETRAWQGAGTDKEDKGLYKAMTGGEKYFLLKTFLVPTGDDPEAEGEHPKPATRRQPAQPLKPEQPAERPRDAGTGRHGSTRTISDPQRKRFYAIAKSHGWADDEIKGLLKETCNVERTDEIPLAQYDKLCAMLEAGTEKVHG